MAKIDILLPYWGDFALLKKTVDSVISQTSPDWTLLILDDHYPSTEAMEYYQGIADDRITYYRHPENIGITNNFNYAVKEATAEFCVILGSDDRLLPNFVEAALKNIGDAAFYQPGVEVIDEDDNVYSPLVDRIKRVIRPRRQGIHKGQELAISLCHGNWLYFPSIVWNTNILKKYPFDARYKIAEDLKVELAIIRDGGSLYIDNEVTFQYRRFAESLSSKEKKKGGVRFNEEAEVHAYFADEFKKMGWKRAALAARVRITSRLHELTSR